MTTSDEPASERVSIRLAAPAHEMAQEEVLKQLAFLSPRIRGGRFDAGGEVLEFDAPTGEAQGLADAARELARKVQRSLRSLQRKVVFRSAAADRPTFREPVPTPGAHQLGVGMVALEGLSLELFEYFDHAFAAMGQAWSPSPLRVPTLIATDVLAKCDYFRSFPHNVTFATHLSEDPAQRESFLARHRDSSSLDASALGQMVTPEACLSPAVCYHVYHLAQGRRLPPAGATYAVSGKCFRYESTNMRDLRRLWDFTMREVVLLGEREVLFAERQKGVEAMARFLDQHDLAGEIRTASDPFFIAPESLAKVHFQLSSDAKYEIALSLPDGAHLAVGSLNHHSDFFGRVFEISLADGGAAHSACIAFGLERWVYAFLAQHGDDPARWPAVVRDGLGAR
jgi:hypothetical protein